MALSPKKIDTNSYFYLRQLVCAYPHAIDRRKYDALASLFTEEAQYHIPHLKVHYKNRDEIVAGIKQVEMFDLTYHTICNHTFDIEGDTATGEVYCIAYHFSPDKAKAGATNRYDMGIRYQDEYAKQQDGRWLFAKRTLGLDWEDSRTLNKPEFG